MKLKSGYPFWAVKNGLMDQFPSLRRPHETEILIVGAGITGALICEEMVSHGHQVTIIDQREVGWGSTAASTALLQYEIDTPLVDLIGLYGKEQGERAYRACREAIEQVEQLAKSVGDVDFQTMQSLYYASSRADVEKLEREAVARLEAGFDLRFVSEEELATAHGLRAPCGILSADGARLDPYRMTYRLLSRVAKKGVEIFALTEVAGLEVGRERVTVVTSSGETILAQHVVMAAGYACQKWVEPKVAKNRSSYAFITDPLEPELLGSLQETMVWESAHPYIYLRSTGDGRLVVGGEDDSVDVVAKRDASIGNKVQRLQEKLKAAFPRLDVEPAFAWAGTFAETEDGLPFFGSHEQYGPRVHFAMAYGGNGITYSAIGARIIASTIEGESHDLRKLFSFDRLTYAPARPGAETVLGKVRAAVPHLLRSAVAPQK